MWAGVKVGGEFSKELANYAAKAYNATSHKVMAGVDIFLTHMQERQELQKERLSNAAENMGKKLSNEELTEISNKAWGLDVSKVDKEGLTKAIEAIGVTKFEDANKLYAGAGVYENGAIVGSISNNKIQETGQSTVTYDKANQKGIAEFKNIIIDAIKKVGDITTEAGKELTIKVISDALDKAGYQLAARTLPLVSLIDTLTGGASSPKALGDPTDVADLLWKQRDKFVEEEKWKLYEQKRLNQNLLLSWEGHLQQQELIKESASQAVKNYLTSINYNNDVKNRLVFPDTKFDFKLYNTLEGRTRVLIEPKR